MKGSLLAIAMLSGCAWYVPAKPGPFAAISSATAPKLEFDWTKTTPPFNPHDEPAGAWRRANHFPDPK